MGTIRVYNPHKPIKPVWGDKDQILMVRRYDEQARGIRPVRMITDYYDPVDDMDEDDEDIDFYTENKFVHAQIECPCCMAQHEIQVHKQGVNYFYNDSEFCGVCQTEFYFDEEREYKLFVKQNKD